MGEKYTTEVTVTAPSTRGEGELRFVFRDSGVTVALPNDSVEMSWSDWEFIAKIYGKKKRR